MNGPDERPARPAAVGAAPPPRLVALLTTVVFVAVLASSTVTVLLPRIGAEFDVGPGLLGWAVTANLLALAAATPLAGALAEVLGLRTTLLLGLALLAAGSLVAALAPAYWVLLGGRVLQGAGEGMLPAVAAVAATQLYPPARRGRVLGLVVGGAGAGLAAGPAVGGVVGQLLGWQALFWSILAATLALVPLGTRLVPARTGAPAGSRVDVPGAVLLAAGTSLLLLGVTQLEDGSRRTGGWGLLAGSAALLLCRWWIVRTPHPIVPPELLGRPRFVGAAVVGSCVQLVNVGVLVLVPLLLTDELALDPGTAALVLTPGPLALAALSPLAGRWADRAGPQLPILVGTVGTAAATVLLSTVAAGPPWAVALAVLALGAALAAVNAPATQAAVEAAADLPAGRVLGLYQSLYFLGGATGPAVAVAVAQARSSTTSGLNPLHAGPATAYSDALLLLAVPALLAVVVAVAALRTAAVRPGGPDPTARAGAAEDP